MNRRHPGGIQKDNPKFGRSSANPGYLSVTIPSEKAFDKLVKYFPDMERGREWLLENGQDSLNYKAFKGGETGEEDRRDVEVWWEDKNYGDGLGFVFINDMDWEGGDKEFHLYSYLTTPDKLFHTKRSLDGSALYSEKKPMPTYKFNRFDTRAHAISLLNKFFKQPGRVASSTATTVETLAGENKMRKNRQPNPFRRRRVRQAEPQRSPGPKSRRLARKIRRKKADVSAEWPIEVFVGQEANPTKGEWVELPMDPDDLEAVMLDISEDGKREIGIMDYSAPFNAEDIGNATQLNNLLLVAEEENIDPDIFGMLVDSLGAHYITEDILRDGDFSITYASDYTDLGHQIVESMGGLDN
jgi:hypothetical protein